MTARAAPVETVGNLKQQWELVLWANRDRRLTGLQHRVLIEGAMVNLGVWYQAAAWSSAS